MNLPRTATSSARPTLARSFVAWTERGAQAPGARPFPDGYRVERAGGLHVAFAHRRRDEGAHAGVPAPHAWLLGDDSEWDAAAPDANLASGVPVRIDPLARRLMAATSIVALPPLFIYRGAVVSAITSDIHLLRHLPGVRLSLDPRGVVELGHFGHPVGHRTLFANVEVAAAASVVTLDDAGEVRVSRSWDLPARDPLDWPAFIEAQIAAFTAQVEALGTQRAFLSLTAGLDTRTVFSSLAARHGLVPAATMTGRRRSLDARIAARLCAAYGVPHEAVVFDERFSRDLPRYVEDASLFSGGLATLDQAPEVFMYDVLGAGYEARISGNLGNQVGRGGTEGVSVRAANVGILAPGIRAPLPAGHWLLEELRRDERSALHFILHAEIPFTLLPNFSVGNHYAAQKSPYASRALIETLARRPVGGAAVASGSRWRMRLRDLRHRFIGEPHERSFQRTLVTRQDGFAARCPINWGWRPAGGVSLPGLALGAATLAGMTARARGIDGGVLRGPLSWSGLPALHDFRDARHWLRHDLRAFTNDVLRGDAVRDARLFDDGVLRGLLDSHYAGRADHYHTLTFALDVALAHRTFCR